MPAAAAAAAPPPPPKRRVCFSFAAYAKAVIEQLNSSGVPVDPGLSDQEFHAIESALSFSFPPDLRSILREGLPVGPGFPNWRSSPPPQLHLPVSNLLHYITTSGFWPESWGQRPASAPDRAAAARVALSTAPPLVPICRHFYIPALPHMAGNPVFHVRGGDVRYAGFDLADFFQREELGLKSGALSPAWVAKTARRIDVWSDLVEGGGDSNRLEECLKEMRWRLREGGWGEEDVQEMMAGGSPLPGDRMVLEDRQSVQWHVRLLALELLRAGWSTEDVVESMGSGDAGRKGSPVSLNVGLIKDGEISFEF